MPRLCFREYWSTAYESIQEDCKKEIIIKCIRRLESGSISGKSKGIWQESTSVLMGTVRFSFGKYYLKPCGILRWKYYQFMYWFNICFPCGEDSLSICAGWCVLGWTLRTSLSASLWCGRTLAKEQTCRWDKLGQPAPSRYTALWKSMNLKVKVQDRTFILMGMEWVSNFSWQLQVISSLQSWTPARTLRQNYFFL